MAKYGSPSAFLLVGGRNLSGENTEITELGESTLERSDGFSKNWPEFTPTGAQKAEFTQKGYYDEDAGKNASVLDGQQSTVQVVCYGVEGLALGKNFVGLEGAFASKYRRVPVRDALLKVEADFSVTGKQSAGAILLAAAQAGSWATSTTVDNTVLTSNGGEAFLQVPALGLGGGTDLVVKIRHSVDDSVYADLVTFAAVTVVYTAERKTVTGTVNRYLRTTGTFTGGAGQTVTPFVGFARAAAA